jgi:hypothetical protein
MCQFLLRATFQQKAISENLGFRIGNPKWFIVVPSVQVVFERQWTECLKSCTVDITHEPRAENKMSIQTTLQFSPCIFALIVHASACPVTDHRSLFFSAWDQSDKFVKVYVTGIPGVSDLPAENISCDFEARWVHRRSYESFHFVVMSRVQHRLWTLRRRKLTPSYEKNWVSMDRFRSLSQIMPVFKLLRSRSIEKITSESQSECRLQIHWL